MLNPLRVSPYSCVLLRRDSDLPKKKIDQKAAIPLSYVTPRDSKIIEVFKNYKGDFYKFAIFWSNW